MNNKFKYSNCNGNISPRLFAILFGLSLMAVGIIIMYSFFSRAQRDPGRTGGEWLVFICPAVIIFGFVVIVRGILSQREIFWQRLILITGVIMLAIGGYPWIYTPYLVGGRPGNEGAGMLGTMLFIMVGVPGLIITIIGALMGGLSSPDY